MLDQRDPAETVAVEHEGALVLEGAPGAAASSASAFDRTPAGEPVVCGVGQQGGGCAVEHTPGEADRMISLMVDGMRARD